MVVTSSSTTVHETSGMRPAFKGSSEGRYYLDLTVFTPLSRMLSQKLLSLATFLTELLGHNCDSTEAKDCFWSSNHSLLTHRQRSSLYFVCSIFSMAQSKIIAEDHSLLQLLLLQPTVQWCIWKYGIMASYKQRLNSRLAIKLLKVIEHRPQNSDCVRAERTHALESLRNLQLPAQRKAAVMLYSKDLTLQHLIDCCMAA